jgi:hypothetical protein
MDLDKKLQELFKTQDEKFKSGLSITETAWHYDGDARPIELDPSTGTQIKRTLMGRVVEFLYEKEIVGLTPQTGIKTFEVRLRLDIKTIAEGDRKEVIGSNAVCGTLENPKGFYSIGYSQRFPKAWAEAKAHRGYVFHSGQWIKSMYLSYLEEQEKPNVNTKSKPSGNH